MFRRTPARTARVLLVALAALTADGCSDPEATRRAEALANADSPLDEGAVRQPIPRGIDPAMVTWRGDGLLVPTLDSLVKTPGYVVDSIFPMEEMIRRFQVEAGPEVSTLAGGSPSMDGLLRAYWSLLASGDTLAMTPLVASKAEFAYLYFPESREPTDGMPPAISWLLLSNNSGRGLTRALRAAATDRTIRGTTCQPLVIDAGRNRITGPCGVIRVRAGRPDTLWFVKHVIARDGIFKLMSFANDL
jgi:hypothetical protein